MLPCPSRCLSRVNIDCAALFEKPPRTRCARDGGSCKHSGGDVFTKKIVGSMMMSRQTHVVSDACALKLMLPPWAICAVRQRRPKMTRPAVFPSLRRRFAKKSFACLSTGASLTPRTSPRSCPTAVTPSPHRNTHGTLTQFFGAFPRKNHERNHGCG